MKRFLALLAIGYAVTLGWLLSLGLTPPFPTSFLALLLQVTLPGAYIVFRVGTAVRESWGDRVDFGQKWLACTAGFFVVGLQLLLQSPWIALAAYFMIVWDLFRHGRQVVGPSLWAVIALLMGYGAVWNLNYALLKLVASRIHDAEVMNLDLVLYEALFRHPVSVEALFPIVRSTQLFVLLESSYPCLFLEVLLILILLASSGGPVRTFLTDVFGCYILGLAVFAVYPVVGPCIAFPESFDPEFQGTLTYALMQSMRQEYVAVLEGGTLSGYGYFVAIPSLHVSMALLFQLYLRRFRVLYWCFLPVNVLMASSTVLLGYHYIIDLPTGLLVVPVVIGIRKGIETRLEPTRRGPADRVSVDA